MLESFRNNGDISNTFSSDFSRMFPRNSLSERRYRRFENSCDVSIEIEIATR
jgi:hypothetical protein